MDHVVVDVEIQKTIEQCSHGWDSTEEMGVAVACVWQHQDQRMRVYGPDDVAALRERLLRADRISGYNIWNFAFPTIWGVAKPDWTQAVGRGAEKTFGAEAVRISTLKSQLRPKTDDLLRRIWVALGFDPDKYTQGTGGCELDDIAGATLGVGKISSGADAPRWFQAGQAQRVTNYCADDVALERALCAFIDRYGYVLRPNGWSKAGDGADAPMWLAGQVQRVTNYCADDVALERDLCAFIDRYGYVLRPNGWSRTGDRTTYLFEKVIVEGWCATAP